MELAVILGEDQGHCQIDQCGLLVDILELEIVAKVILANISFLQEFMLRTDLD